MGKRQLCAKQVFSTYLSQCLEQIMLLQDIQHPAHFLVCWMPCRSTDTLFLHLTLPELLHLELIIYITEQNLATQVAERV